jgi:hypothetical protein
MRNIHFLLFFILFAIAAVGVLSEMANQDPRGEARKFLSLVKEGAVQKALGEFGDNTCHCAPKGGYGSYFKLESGVDPNIAFLKGQEFSEDAKLPMVPMADKQPYLFPWDKPETFALDAQVHFNAREKSPYFLPMDTAFGQEITEADLDKFAANPADGGQRAFSLRVRHTLSPGYVPPHVPSKEDEEAEKAAKEVLTPEMAKYLYPRDAGQVKLFDGKSVPVEQLADRLPRLYSVVVRLYIVRRGQLSRWTIKKLQLHDAVLINNKGERAHLLETRAPAPSDLETPDNSS